VAGDVCGIFMLAYLAMSYHLMVRYPCIREVPPVTNKTGGIRTT